MARLGAISEHLGFEPPHRRPLLPGVAWQAGFVARLRQERLSIPMPLGGDLRKQQAAMPSQLHHETVAADFDIVGADDRFERAEQRELELEVR